MIEILGFVIIILGFSLWDFWNRVKENKAGNKELRKLVQSIVNTLKNKPISRLYIIIPLSVLCFYSKTIFTDYLGWHNDITMPLTAVIGLTLIGNIIILYTKFTEKDD